LVDLVDLKSIAIYWRAGSSPAVFILSSFLM
jgi:hypothetical protein